MRNKELYEAVLRAIKRQVLRIKITSAPNDYKFCSNCIAHLVKAELNNISFFDYKGYSKFPCLSPLLYLEDHGIIKILGKNPNNSTGIDCCNLEVKAIHNFERNKI